MSDILLEIKDLYVKYESEYETVNAVNGVSLKLEKGKTLGIVGETGAGKTTLAMTVMRLLPERTGKVTGEVYLEGQSLFQKSEKEMRGIRGKKMSMIFQDPMSALNPVLTVGDQIEEALRLHNEKKRTKAEMAARVDEVLEIVGIPKSRRNDYPQQFSGGMKQRVVIAIALACEPELLIADEPTTALDVTIQAQVLALMDDLQKKLNTAMIMITHDLGVVAKTCDNVAVMYAGKIIESGTLKDIFSEGKHHPYTVGLFNSIPKLDDEREWLEPIDGLMPDPTALPAGCAFSPRCPHCTAQCSQAEVGVFKDGTHEIRCVLFAGSDENNNKGRSQATGE